ncbi:nucleotidyltransferase [Christensenellaceae bacterium OttesenSCG-928-L17]|nr:nucleotidyltransferase [Christensenellaceae bacterium OttesenSCG-928-L17]
MKRMASPISQSEDEKCKNAIKMVRDAMKKLNYTDDDKEIRSYLAETFSYSLEMRQKFTDKKITILVQGSYANKTNIPSESDVDVAIILESTFITTYRSGVIRENYGFTEGTFSAEELKDEVEKALNQHFGYQGVERHDKCIKVIGNTYRVDADVVPSYRHRDYSKDYDNNVNNYVGGIEIRPDSGGSIINYPEQHIRMDIEKNKACSYNFKPCVRIVKNMREKMGDNGYHISAKISSFGLESLLWNVANAEYTKYPSILRYTFDEVVKFLKNDFSNFGNYFEANGIKSLFTDETTKTAYKQFITDLSAFYEYDI